MRNQPQQSSMQRLGISANPLEQLSGLVSLINASQAPAIQQGQFQQEMGFRQLMGDRGYEHDQAQLDQHAFDQQQGQDQFNRHFAQQAEQNQIQDDYNQGQLLQRQQNAQFAQTDRRQQMMMDLMQLFMQAGSDPNGPGMLNMEMGNALGMQQGFPQMFNLDGPQGPQAPYDTSKINQDIPDAAFRPAFQKHTGR